MNNPPKIQFERWQDPYGADTDKRDLPTFKSENEDGEEETINMGEMLEEQQPIKVIMTNLGMIPLTEHTIPSKNFNFWTGHTNFHITKRVSALIAKLPGVEVYHTFSPYRFRVGIAKLFEETEVMDEIKKDVYQFLNG